MNHTGRIEVRRFHMTGKNKRTDTGCKYRGAVRRTLLAVILILISVFPGSGPGHVRAIESTAYTYTIAADRFGYLRTQDAYIPGGIYLKEIGMKSPEDLYYKDGILYIADSGNARIVRYDLLEGRISFLGEGELKYPTGVAVDEDGMVYVADYQASEVVLLSQERGVVKRIGRPEDMIYGASPFKPRKVDVDSFGNIFAISEGTHEGILQFGEDGRFNGFFGANKTKGLNLIEWFQKTFYTEEQKAKLFFRTPPNIVSLDVADTNLIYSVTQNDSLDALKKLNLAGVNVLQRSGRIWGEENYVDAAVTTEGNIFAVTDTGSIEEFDDTGVLMILFGGRAAASDRNGLTAVVSAIEVDENDNIYILDKERALIQAYYPTSYTKLLHKAKADYNKGDYTASLEGWTEILRLSPSAYMAHNGFAQAMFELGEYETAAEHYRIMGDGWKYSECYWELRSSWLREHMDRILMLCIGIAIVLLALWFVQKKSNYRKYIREEWEKQCKRHRLLKELMVDSRFMLRHPIDGIYYLKTGRRGSVRGATILYIAAYIVYMIYRLYTSFVFGGGINQWQSPAAISVIVILPVILFVVGSYLISSINDGEGTIKNVYVSFGYALSGYITYIPVLTLVSHVLTKKESFLYGLCYFMIIGYTLVLIFLAVKETHCYTPGKTVSNILLTIAFMVIAVLAFIILYILWKELLGFAAELLEEVKYRVIT